jgi:hypothetical protein
MNFLEKDLETIIFENYEACEQRGLRIDSAAFALGRRYRQFNLGAYGVADLVNVHYDAAINRCWVQVIECKRGPVTVATYQQAKRYVTGLQQVFAKLYDYAQVRPELVFSTVLIGSHVASNDPFGHVVAQDRSCTSYSYSYGIDGINFSDCSIYWWADSTHEDEGILGAYHELDDYLAGARMEWRTEVGEDGDHTKPLLVTADGVLLNPALER